jgi:hypothetical protein
MSMVTIAFTGRGVVTMGDYTSDGEDGREDGDENGSAHCVDLLSGSMVVRARRCG